MKEKLIEIVTKAVLDPVSYPDLVLIYQRGHDLSGVTHFKMQATGAYALSYNSPKRQTSGALNGEMDAGRRNAILTAVDESGLLSIPSSTRNIGDDELPIEVELRFHELSHTLDIWAEDARENASFIEFERALWPVMRELSEGGVGLGPDYTA